MQENSILQNIEEKRIKAKSGWGLLIIFLIYTLISAGLIIFFKTTKNNFSDLSFSVIGGLWFVVMMVVSSSLKIIQPNQALVLTLFGKYYGTVSSAGYYAVNPFTTKNKISLKAKTLNNQKQKVNDEDGNPIEIGVVVVWKVADTALASFAVENYTEFMATQTDSAIRNVARQFPYDVSADGKNELSLRGSSDEISGMLKKEIQERVDDAGIDIIEARISHLAYAPEIAAVMLQRQQAAAVISAKQMIVEGAVGMVEMALDKLKENNVVELDEERKAQMVSNLLVVLCSDKSSQPIVNTSTIY